MLGLYHCPINVRDVTDVVYYEKSRRIFLGIDWFHMLFRLLRLSHPIYSMNVAQRAILILSVRTSDIEIGAESRYPREKRRGSSLLV